MRRCLLAAGFPYSGFSDSKSPVQEGPISLAKASVPARQVRIYGISSTKQKGANPIRRQGTSHQESRFPSFLNLHLLWQNSACGPSMDHVRLACKPVSQSFNRVRGYGENRPTRTKIGDWWRGEEVPYSEDSDLHDSRAMGSLSGCTMELSRESVDAIVRCFRVFGGNFPGVPDSATLPVPS
ncbi:hypothetical protein AB1N83_012136 [Pleurotus pulmonarius]